MWYRLGRFILRNRLLLLILLTLATGFLGWQGSKVQLSYDFTRAVPTDNPRYIEYQAFLKKFGADNNTMVAGIESDKMFTPVFFNAVAQLHQRVKTIPGVTEVLSIPEAVTLVKDSAVQKLKPARIFHTPYTSQAALDSDRHVFENLPFYRGLLYNPDAKTYLLGIGVNKDTINSKSRTRLINDIMKEIALFEKNTGATVHASGLPFIRTSMSNRIKDEMNWFLIGSLVLSAITLLLFFRSFSAMLMSLAVVGMGVVWSLGTLVLFGYKITLLTALIPPLVVVIGVPNCIYFLNKYHSAYRDTNDKEKALINMVGRMGVVTLFCNIAAAIGFAVFALTRSDLLKEFGVVAGVNIMALFLISLVFIPSVLSYLSVPKPRHIRYLDNAFLEKMLLRIERWAFQRAAWVYGVTAVLCILAVMGMFRLKSEGFIVDDLPKNDRIYTDLKWFEKNFGGVMPLEIVVDTKKKKGILRSAPISKIDELSAYIGSNPAAARPLSFVEGLKFAKQAYFDGDSLSYAVPYEGDLVFMAPYLRFKNEAAGSGKGLMGIMRNFIDSNQQVARISVNMKDVGSARLPLLIADFEHKAGELFDTASYHISFTGSSVSFLEGSGFIIKGLKDSIFWAFLLITLCMFYLFRSVRILVCSLVPNLVPLLITAGVMGWSGIALKPSTVLVFSVALGIAIDVTIRFLVNYKQELPHYNYGVKKTLEQTIRHTGISIIYTSLVLIAGFVIFCFSSFGGTKALGWLTSLTLVVGTLTNLALLPVLILSVSGKSNKA
ncbi:efflux RND transporter permease subunit [Sediminibacterium soli]|uniref:efflux RND transporter permease subunit n=1 Tax=Sediminibacterium soli TaxID=2698829 RepID=UPI00137B6313|nr:MMPL family transporter [Sediminibacterium soli]NCI47601.1 MMPL family transporter [Sediminibacterium soli]